MHVHMHAPIKQLFITIIVYIIMHVTWVCGQWQYNAIYNYNIYFNNTLIIFTTVIVTIIIIVIILIFFQLIFMYNYSMKSHTITITINFEAKIYGYIFAEVKYNCCCLQS